MQPILKKQTSTKSSHGFTLLELMIVIAIIGTLAAIAIPQFTAYRERTVKSTVIVEMRNIEKEIILYLTGNGTYPATLSDIGLGGFEDPWGNPYVYYPMDNVPPKVKIRKDKSLHPVNTDFDLYSMGKDGQSKAPFTAKASRDDLVRCSNGAFWGYAEDY